MTDAGPRVPGRRGPTLATALVLALVALAGCAAFPFVGPTCGPGDTDVGAITGNVSEVHVKGELTHLNATTLLVDDGTGQAVIPVGEDLSGEVSTGDCVIATGAATSLDGGDHEALVLYSTLSKEEVVVGEEARRRG